MMNAIFAQIDKMERTPRSGVAMCHRQGKNRRVPVRRPEVHHRGAAARRADQADSAQSRIPRPVIAPRTAKAARHHRRSQAGNTTRARAHRGPLSVVGRRCVNNATRPAPPASPERTEGAHDYSGDPEQASPQGNPPQNLFPERATTEAERRCARTRPPRRSSPRRPATAPVPRPDDRCRDASQSDLWTRA